MELSAKEIRCEMARRYLAFHKGQEIEKIEILGLFSVGSVRRAVKSGRIIPIHQRWMPARGSWWYKPSPAECEKIKKIVTRRENNEK